MSTEVPTPAACSISSSRRVETKSVCSRSPATADELFAQHGGRATALSYGVEIDFADPEKLRRAHRELLSAVPRSHVEFLFDLQFTLTMGDFFFCHAGVRPGVALDDQDPRDLIWIRGDFHRHSGLYEKIIVHGHTPAGEPEIMSNRVNLDTGAFMSGTLSALVIDGRDKQILQVSDREFAG
jgi:serine/threonine protein phosphatase 1